MHSYTPETSDDPIEDVLARLADAESRLATLAREVEHLQRLATIGTVAAGIVHEINNQLTPALAQAQIARLSAAEPPRLAQSLDQCIHGITRAGRIAETLIGYAMPSDDAQGQRKGGQSNKAANIAQALKSALTCLGILRDRPGQAHIQIEADVPPAAWALIEPLALQQVLINLLLNASKALANTSDPMIRVSTQSIDGDGIVIVVEDNGPGIPSAVRKNLFKPFVTEAASKRSPKGTGLGLTISQRLVQGAGGSIEAGSSEWGGAKFTIRLRSMSARSNAKTA